MEKAVTYNELVAKIHSITAKHLGIRPSSEICPRCNLRQQITLLIPGSNSWTGHGLCAPCMYENQRQLMRSVAKERDEALAKFRAASSPADAPSPSEDR